MKPYIDGLVNEIIEDDDAMRITYEIRFEQEPGEQENTIIEIKEL